MKKILSLLTMTILCLTLVGCGKSEVDTSNIVKSTNKYVDGTFTSKAKGHEGDIEVEVVVENSEIKSVKILETKETIKNAEKSLPSIIVSANTYEVDTVAGNTESSRAILKAVKEVLQVK